MKAVNTINRYKKAKKHTHAFATLRPTVWLCYNKRTGQGWVDCGLRWLYVVILCISCTKGGGMLQRPAVRQRTKKMKKKITMTRIYRQKQEYKWLELDSTLRHNAEKDSG